MAVLSKPLKEYLKVHINAYATKYQDCSAVEVKEYLLDGGQGGFEDEMAQVSSSKTFYNFVLRQIQKVKESGSLDRKKGSGRPQTPQAKVQKIIKLAVHKKYTGTCRSVSSQVGVSKTTVAEVLKRNGYKSISARQTQGKHILSSILASLLIHCDRHKRH